MSTVLTRSPLVSIGMNSGSTQKRRSARLSQEGNAENEPPAKKAKVNGSATTLVSTNLQDGDNSKTAGKRKKKVYDEEVEGFAFKKGKRSKGKEAKDAAVSNPSEEKTAPESVAPAPATEALAPKPEELKPSARDTPPKTAARKTRRRLPATPERDAAEQPSRRSKRLSNEKAVATDAQQVPEPSAGHPSHAKSHADVDRERSPTPERARPVTIEKKRKHGANGVEEEKVMTISLPFADTPVIRRNQEMRKNSAESHRRSSAGMRGKRASSLIDEGRGHEASKDSPASRPSADGERERFSLPSHAIFSEDFETSPLCAEAYFAAPKILADDEFLSVALPHTEVHTSEFFKHISADLTEPRRMRCLLGWCGTRALPPKPDTPRDSTPEANLEFESLQTARVIQEELSQDLVTRGTLSDWFSRDDSAPSKVPLRKKPNPRNISNAAKAEELERELARLKQEQADWEEIVQSAVSASSTAEPDAQADGHVSPVRPEVMDIRQRTILEKLQLHSSDVLTESEDIRQRLRQISDDLEFAVDQFAHGIHALSTSRETAERVAEKSLADAASALEARDRRRSGNGAAVGDQMDALRGLARVLNAQYKS